MGASHAATLNALLDEALQLPVEARAAWLDALGPEYDAVKARLRGLLARAAETEAPELHTLPKLNERERLSQMPACVRSPGTRVGRYRLQRRIGIGGMGVVWLASEQLASGERLVALKFAHLRPDRTDLHARLARERAALAALQHPNIARLYDAGVAEDDERLYLVLEYIEGLPLDQYCVERQANIARRLALFVQVADAMVHAHERRIVHRDLKPANVLVTAEGETKLLDFGVAKLLGEEGSQLQLSRMTGMPLTPEYASPEQVAGKDVGFSSDIYSLGVMLYELLTGVRPYACDRGSNRALREAILDRRPEAPSQVVGDGRAVLLRGELDALVLRALGKRPEDRFASMREFAEQIEDQARRVARMGSSGLVG